MASLEQQARDLLERAGVEDAQSMTAGDLGEIANLIRDAKADAKDQIEFQLDTTDCRVDDGWITARLTRQQAIDLVASLVRLLR